MNRRHFTFGALLGLLGAKAMGQDKPHLGLHECKGPTDDNCYIDPDKEACPLGHNQKPKIVSNDNINISGIPKKHCPLDYFEPHVCSVCGVVYIPPVAVQKSS